MKIKFTENALYETDGYRKGHTFKAGEVHDFPDHFAQRWIRRGAAVEVDSAPRFKPLTRVVGKEEGEAAEQPAPEPLPDLETMTKADLEEFATGRGVDLSGARTKADIIEAIEAST
jgi:hypothetical protein